MESTNNRGDEAPTRHLMLPKSPVPEMKMLLRCWPKEFHEKPQTIQAIDKTICVTLHDMMVRPYCHQKLRSQAGVLTTGFTPLMFMILESTLHVMGRESIALHLLSLH